MELLLGKISFCLSERDNRATWTNELPQAGPDKSTNLTVNLSQDIAHLKKLLASVNQMLMKGREHYQLLE
uniref:Uncharacterized protein n=1 Tax=Sphaerodactylus townsendi TaxID=933632 RepID=A0ACB8G5N2_9SAUR